jgi:PAS domain S-box-containing protein
MTTVPMPKDICCENFKGLLAYVQNHYGDDGVRILTDGLLDGEHCVRDKFEPDRIVPVDLGHLTDPAYWVSNAFSLALLANVKKLVPGPNPLYTAGKAMVRENLSLTTLFAAKLAGIRRLARRAAKINNRFNRTKDVHLAHLSDTAIAFELNYRTGYAVTKDVCNWNLGIYAGIGTLTGVADVSARETACVLEGAPSCRFEITWQKRPLLFRGLRAAGASVVRWMVKELIADYEKNIEEREALIEKLAASENKYRTFFEDSLEAMSLSSDGILMDVNPAWLNLHGHTNKAKVLGKGVIDFIHPDDRSILKTRRKNWPRQFERAVRMRDLARDGTTIDVEVFSSRIEFNGKVAFLATVRDISELKEAESRRQQLEARLQRAEKMEAVAALAGGVAHDLNNILSGMVGYPDLILMQLEENSPLVSPVKTIQDSGKKAAAIVQDLLTLARRGVTAREVTNLNQVVTEYTASPEYAKLLSYHPAVRVTVDTAPDLLNLNGSPVHLSKTLMNLVSNAAEAMPDGGELTIETRNHYFDPHQRGFEEIPEGDYCILVVGDTGTGIPEADLEKVFEPFYTSKKMGRSGTGLGMAVVWGTVKDHGGYIRIESRIGTGTAIRLFFPATRSALTEMEMPADIGHFKGNGEAVLVVDDLPEQREIAGQMLKALGYRVSAAASGEEAVTQLQETPCDLVLLDMIMDPGIDGLETYRRILSNRPGQKAVIATGYSKTERVTAALSLGAGATIQKPYTFDKLGRTVRTELDRPATPG